MLHVKDRQSFNFQFGAFTVMVFHTVVFLALIHSCRGQSQVIGPSQPIVATVGEDIIFPCHLDPVMNVNDMLLEWARPDLDPRFVLVWRDGLELEGKKHPSYKGRTSLFINKLKLGNVSLKLSKVKISDEGTYRCFVPELGRDSFVQLVVGAASSPVIQETRNRSGQLECESEGWYPEPEVFWLDGEGHLLSAGPTETFRGPDGFYKVRSRVTVEKRHGNSFTCRVQQKTINQTRETQIHVPENNKKRSCEDRAEQNEDEKVTSTNHNTGFQVVMEGEGESVPLMAGREEEENNVDNRGEEKIKSPSERKDQFVTERETHQHQQAEPIRDVDGAEGGRKESIKDKVPLIPTEGETHQDQDMIGRQVRSDHDKGEGEQKMKPVKEDSGLPGELVAERQIEQQQNVHSDQEVKKEEETRQESMNDDKKVKNKRANKKNEQERAKKESSASTRQKKQRGNQREQKQLEVERLKVENERKLQSEMKTRKDEIELKPQQGNGNQHLSEDKKQEGSMAEPEDKDQEVHQSNATRTTERKAENQKEQINEELKETEEKRMENERELQSDGQREDKIKLKTQNRDVNQHVLDVNKQEAEHQEQSNITTKTEKKAEKQRELIIKKLKETEEKRDEREKKLPSVSRDVTERPDLKIHQETARRKNQVENQLQAEKLQEGTSQRNQEETKDQPERSTRRVKVERREDGLEADKGAHRKEIRQRPLQTNVKEEIREKLEESSKFLPERGAKVLQEEQMQVDETQRKSEELRRESQQQTLYHLYRGGEIRERPKESSKFLTERGAECQEVLQEEQMQVDETQQKFTEIRQESQPQTLNQLYGGEEIREKPEESYRFLTDKRVQYQEVLQEEPMESDETQVKSEEIREEGQQQTVQQLYGKEDTEYSKFLTHKRAESQEVLQEEPMETYETQQTFMEIRQEGQQQTVQQLYLKEEIRERPEETYNFLTERGAECQEVLQEDTKPDTGETQTQRKVEIGEKRKEEEPYEDRVQIDKKKMRLEEVKVQRVKTKDKRGTKKR